MNDRDLFELKELAVPPPSAEARDDAIKAALAAFDQRLNFSEANEPQGLLHSARHSHASRRAKRSKSMRGIPFNYSMAASIAALMVAAPAAFYVFQHNKDSYFNNTALNKPAATGPGLVSADKSISTPKPVEIPNRDASEARRAQEASKIVAEAYKKRDEDRRDAAPAASATAPQSPAPSAGEIHASATQPDREPAKPDAKFNRRPAAVAAAPTAPPPPPDLTMRLIGRLGNEQTASAGSMPSPIAGLTGNVRLDKYGTPVPADHQFPGPAEEFRDQFDSVASNPVKRVAEEPVSTFSIDVDTASYGFVRRVLNEGRMPPKNAVRVEEMINYFPYDYPKPESAETPFKPTITVFPAPWNATNRIVHVAIKGFEVKATDRPRANLVFLIDTSGSMMPPDRLPLVKNALRMLVDQLKPDDTIGIVTYASGSGIALEPTKVADKSKILSAIDQLIAGGSTAGASGIEDAYRLAEASFDKSSVNRIILATDGDFNVGITDRDALKGFVERKRESGIFLSILGVGRGNYNDSLMQTLAQNGNGTASYIDTLNEARKVLVDEASSTLFTIAKDVKIQLEFNPARVAEYRLIGYETRNLKREDFNNDKVDAGDIGSGHTVTAMYEVTPVGAPTLVEDLRYGKPAATPASATSDSSEIGYLKLRYKLPSEQASKLTTLMLDDNVEKASIAEAGNDVRFSTSVAAFGQLLRGDTYMKDFRYDDVIALANPAKGDDPFGYRAEFLNLVRLAKSAQP